MPYTALAAGLIVAGCAAPRIDTSSDETAAVSMKQVRQSLPEDRRELFDEAIMTITFSKATDDLFGLAAIASASPETMKAQMLAPLDGKTGEEVIAEGNRIIEERKAKERAQALQEIKELQELQARATKDRQELAKFTVSRSRFRQSKNVLGMKEAVIELTVKNGTASAVARVHFTGTIASPGRSVPWLKEDFNYSISGGIEPGETAKWSLAPNMFSEWGKVDVPRDAILTVEVVRLDGADNEALFDASVFGEEQAERLASLRKEYARGLSAPTH